MASGIFQHLQDHIGQDLLAFLPELLLCGTIVLMLLMRMFSSLNRLHMGYVALVLTIAAFGISWCQWTGCSTFDPRSEGTNALPIFSGLLIYDNFTIFIRLFLFAATGLVIWLTMLTGIPDRDDSADFYCLLLGATIGMSMMASAAHLLMIFIAVEMASLPSYAMAGFLKGRRLSSEASLKYVVYGSGAAGVMLYGMSILAGKFGTAYLPELAARLLTVPQLDVMLILGILFILIGVAFKLAAVPFHFWCPDVFEGASAEVAAFLSVASKGAALALLGRFALVLAGLAGIQPHPAAWQEVVPYLVPALAIFATLTATFGNLAAYSQTNLKRLLAYSTIAHAGYMMMALATMTRDGSAAMLFYLVVYLFMNLGAFAVVAFLRDLTGSEDLADYRGLVTRAPVLVITMSVFLLSLLGIPPLAGFVAKFQIFRVLYDAGTMYASSAIDMPELSYLMITLLFVAGINTVVSLFYYVKVMKVMILDKPIEEVEGKPSEPLTVSAGPTGYVSLLALMMLVLGILWSPLATNSAQGVNPFRPVSVSHHAPSPRAASRGIEAGENPS